MVKFFFYNKLTNVDLIKKINHNFEIYDGYILIQNYDNEKNILEICGNSLNNNNLLYGKIVDFNMKLDNVIQKINQNEDCKLENKIKYSLEQIWANKIFGGAYKAYIIY